MFDMHGRVVGILSHTISKSGGTEGLGFAMSISPARQLRDVMRTMRQQAEFTVTVLRLGHVIELKGRKP